MSCLQEIKKFSGSISIVYIDFAFIYNIFFAPVISITVQSSPVQLFGHYTDT